MLYNEQKMKNKTRAYQSETRAEMIGFTNYERIDEDELFKFVLEKLKSIPEINIGEVQIDPSEDYYKCTISREEFTLFFDINYGVFIHAKSPHSREMLLNVFNK